MHITSREYLDPCLLRVLATVTLNHDGDTILCDAMRCDAKSDRDFPSLEKKKLKPSTAEPSKKGTKEEKPFDERPAWAILPATYR